MTEQHDVAPEQSQSHLTTDGELVSALSVVEAQPLEARAEGYSKLYDELRAQLEGGDLPTRD